MMDYHEVINFVLDYVESNQYLLTNAYNAVGQAGLPAPPAVSGFHILRGQPD